MMAKSSSSSPSSAANPSSSSHHRLRRHHPSPLLPLRRRSPPPPPPPPPPPRTRTLRPRRSRPLLASSGGDDFLGLSSSSSPSSHSSDSDDADSSSSDRRRRRKLKLVVKLSQIRSSPPPPSRHRRRPAASSWDSEASSYLEDGGGGEDADEEHIKPPKKRRLERSRHRHNGRSDAATRSKRLVGGTPMPDRRTLEAVLDKLQKKDTYGVFAEPVDPEELPDYHDVIEHPMDFGTVRKKLTRSVYRSFEQFEDDVFLICSNAMQYNAPDTIYFRQAHSIQEMARKKFQEVRDESISTENEGKSEQKVRLSSCHKESNKKPIFRNEEDDLGDSCHKEPVKKPICRNGDDLGYSYQEEPVRKPICRNGDDLGYSYHKELAKKPISRNRDDRGYSYRKEPVKKPMSRNGDDLGYPYHKEPVKKPICRNGEDDIGYSCRKESVKKPICRNEDNLGCFSRKESVKKPICRNEEDDLGDSYHEAPVKMAIHRTGKDDLGNSCHKEPIKKHISRNGQDALGSDISAASVASAGDGCNGLSTAQAKAVQPEVPAVIDGYLDNSSPLGEIKSEKADELSARDSPVKPTYKPAVVDENRRFTYDLSEELPLSESHPIFDVFASEPKNLIAVCSVGLDAEYSYARSLARFAASLGSNGWKIACERIKKALPAEVKFGRGWVGEYEPLSTAILSLDDQSQNLLPCKSNLPSEASLATPKDIERPKTAENVNPRDTRFGVHTPITASNAVGVPGPMESPELKPRLFGVTTEPHRRNSDAGVPQESQKVTAGSAKAKVTSNEQSKKSCSASLNSLSVEVAPQRPECTRGATSGMHDMASSRKMNGQPKHFFQPQEGVAMHPRNEATWVYHGRASDKIPGNSDKSRPSTGMGFITKNQQGIVGNFAINGTGQKNISDHTKLVGSSAMLGQSDKPNKGHDAPRNLFATFPSAIRENHSTQAPPAAQSWISFGASSDSKPSIGSPSFLDSSGWRIPFANVRACDDPKTRTVPQFFRQPTQFVNRENSVQSKGLVIFPQLVATDFSRPQSHAQWQGLVQHTQQKPSKDTLRPDLNIGFPSPGSPARQSSGINLEAQQPDLALQL